MDTFACKCRISSPIKIWFVPNNFLYGLTAVSGYSDFSALINISIKVTLVKKKWKLISLNTSNSLKISYATISHRIWKKIKAYFPLVIILLFFTTFSFDYHISLNKSRPLINVLPRIIAPPHPSCHLLFLLSPPCQVEGESDPAKLISDDSSFEN